MMDAEWRACWANLAPSTAQQLEADGWRDAGRLDALQDLGDGELLRALRPLGLAEARALVLAAGAGADLARRYFARLPAPFLLPAAPLSETGFTAPAAAAPPRPPPGRLGHWPRARPGEDQAAAVAAEDAEKERLQTHLVGILTALRMPAVELAQHSLQPARALSRCFRGRRLSTVRQRLRAWDNWMAWLLQAKGYALPQHVADLTDYLEDRAAEPCGRSCLATIVNAVAFVEAAGGLAARQRWSCSPVVQGAMQELVTLLAQGRPGEGARRRPSRSR